MRPSLVFAIMMMFASVVWWLWPSSTTKVTRVPEPPKQAVVAPVPAPIAEPKIELPEKAPEVAPEPAPKPAVRATERPLPKRPVPKRHTVKKKQPCPWLSCA